MAEVDRYFRQGRIQDIVDYCESDVVNTYRVWLRHELFRGKLSRSSFNSANKILANSSKLGVTRSRIWRI